MATKQDRASSGPPRWTHIVGAAVAVGGLLWGVASFFISKPEAPKAAAPAPVAPAPSVSVSGTGNIGVGNMSGGQITGGATPPQQPASAGGAR